jgi:hypothetical protein
MKRTPRPWKMDRAIIKKLSPCYFGTALLTNIEGALPVIIVAENSAALDAIWESLFPLATINPTHRKQVALFDQKVTRVED